MPGNENIVYQSMTCDTAVAAAVATALGADPALVKTTLEAAAVSFPDFIKLRALQ